MYKMFFPSGNAEEFCDHVFRTFDMDKNGYIDFKVSGATSLNVFLNPSPLDLQVVPTKINQRNVLMVVFSLSKSMLNIYFT